ncbi:MAG: hypothetical protein P1V20_09430 [Verrucomicrobiales bacterium]|nr:hypothetical protein [Verrucomicrobiales bacterium]
MKILFCSLFVVLSAGLIQAADPEDLNCDFEGGMDRWRGDGRLTTDESGNRVCVLKKTNDRKKEIAHKIELPGAVSFEIHYRVRAMPGSENVVLRRSVRNPRGAGFSGAELKPDGKWVSQKFNAKGEEGQRESDRIIAITFHEGEGEIQIDDIKVVVKK